MSSLEMLTNEVVKDAALKSALKSATSDEEFANLLVAQGNMLGIHVSKEAIFSKMADDRVISSGMIPEEFERVAGTMLGARLSGGHQSGSNC